MWKNFMLENGRVYSNSNNAFAARDIQIEYGRIRAADKAAPDRDIPPCCDMKNLYIIPPMVDFHCHLYYGGSNLAFDPELLAHTGVMYACDGGSAGLSSITGLKHFADRIKNKIRVYYWLNVASVGLHENFLEMQNQYYLRLDSFAGIYDLIKDNLIGLTLRLNHLALKDSVDAEFALSSSLELAEELKLPLMVHISRPCYPVDFILQRMRPGDVVTEIFHGEGEGILDNYGKIRKSFLEARDRGVMFDLAHGANNFSFDVAAKCIQQGFLPDFISTNLSRLGYQKAPLYSMYNLLSKLLALGVPLEEIVRRVTTVPARYLKIAGYPYDLDEGGEASLACFQLAKGRFVFRDSSQKLLTGESLFEPVLVVRRGNVVFRQERFML